jgi:hypothetical protein
MVIAASPALVVRAVLPVDDDLDAFALDSWRKEVPHRRCSRCAEAGFN